jgi:hypothetical protein
MNDKAEVVTQHDAEAGNLILSTAGPREVLRFEANGDVYVRGEKVDSNKEIYEAFKAFLVQCGTLRP